jgi:glycosyltransferase involved in cell wall biosynthesis
MMESRPSVSIIMPCYNGQQYIADAIESVLRQEYQDFEIIIIDDASTDSSYQVIEAYLSDTRISFHRNLVNGGIPLSRNAGILRSKGDFITFLDQDDFWLPEFLSSLIGESRNKPDCGLIFCDFYLLFENKGARRIIRNPNPPKPYKFLKRLFLHRISIETFMQTALVKRECFDSLGLLDESLKVLDDFEFWLRVAGRYPMGRLDVPLVVKRQHAESALGKSKDAVFIDKLSISVKAPRFYPELTQYVSRRDSTILCDWALFLMKSGDFKGAKSRFMQSLRSNNLNTLTYVGLLSLLFGKKGRYIITFPRWLRLRAIQIKRALL